MLYCTAKLNYDQNIKHGYRIELLSFMKYKHMCYNHFFILRLFNDTMATAEVTEFE